LQFIVDTFFVSLYYFLTGNVDSELYLNFALPMLIIIEHGEKPQAILFYYSLLCITYFITLALITTFSEEWGFFHNFYRAFIPRVLFSFLVLSFAIARRYLLEAQAVELAMVSKIATHISNREDLHTRLETILDGAITIFKAKGGYIYLRKPGETNLALMAFKGIKNPELKQGCLLSIASRATSTAVTHKSPMIENDNPKSELMVPELAQDIRAVMEAPIYS
jgi:hypothetical protein